MCDVCVVVRLLNDCLLLFARFLLLLLPFLLPLDLLNLLLLSSSSSSPCPSFSCLSPLDFPSASSKWFLLPFSPFSSFLLTLIPFFFVLSPPMLCLISYAVSHHLCCRSPPMLSHLLCCLTSYAVSHRPCCLSPTMLSLTSYAVSPSPLFCLPPVPPNFLLFPWFYFFYSFPYTLTHPLTLYALLWLPICFFLLLLVPISFLHLPQNIFPKKIVIFWGRYKLLVHNFVLTANRFLVNAFKKFNQEFFW